jgi:hypothetical protein
VAEPGVGSSCAVVCVGQSTEPWSLRWNLQHTNVDSLKDAVKAKAAVALTGCDVFTLTVKDDKGNVLEVEAPLQANSKQAAYIVE